MWSFYPRQHPRHTETCTPIPSWSPTKVWTLRDPDSPLFLSTPKPNPPSPSKAKILFLVILYLHRVLSKHRTLEKEYSRFDKRKYGNTLKASTLTTDVVSWVNESTLTTHGTLSTSVDGDGCCTLTPHTFLRFPRPEVRKKIVLCKVIKI